MELKVFVCLFSFYNICVGIPYEDDDYRDNNGDYDDDRSNDLSNMRPYDHHNGNRYNQDMNRQTHFDVGGGRDPPMEYGFRGFGGLGGRPVPLQPLQAQQAQQPQQQQLQQQQQQVQPQPLGAAGYDGGRAGQFGYTPYGQYTYNPYGWNRPGYYGWNRPVQSADPWRGTSSVGLGFPFNLLGLGGGSSAYRPWWSLNRFPFGLF